MVGAHSIRGDTGAEFRGRLFLLGDDGGNMLAGIVAGLVLVGDPGLPVRLAVIYPPHLP
jgi:hypothetical protein